MRGDEFLDKMELVHPSYIEQADAKQRNSVWIRWGVLAACFCFLASCLLLIPNWEAPTDPLPPSVSPSDPSPLPLITVPPLVEGAGGHSALIGFDISDLENGNPWKQQMHFDSLPVYKNGAYDPSQAGIPLGLSLKQMEEKLQQAVSALQLQILSTEVRADGLDDKPTEICAQTDYGTVYVWANGTVRYLLPNGGEKLPDGFSFTASTAEQAEATVTYLGECYRQLLHLQSPTVALSKNYGFDGTFFYRYSLYDGDADPLQSILNFSFQKVNFSGYGQTLYHLDLQDGLSLAEKTGEYPTITVQQATQRLVEGYYQTGAGTAFPGEQSIERVELVYRSGPLEEIFLPYYLFYVDISDALQPLEKGLKEYGLYFVPAITDEYIDKMPLYNDRFR